MKKIMFNDKYGLTDAVLEGRKTMTRRIVTFNAPVPTYKMGEEVAIAQKYRDLCNCNAFYDALHKADPTFPLECIKDEKGCNNKMFVKAEWMPHRIRIIDVKTERVQDISEDDCLREGLLTSYQEFRAYGFSLPSGAKMSFPTPRIAFAALFDRICGRGTWFRNPWVFAYEFELIWHIRP